MEANFNFTIFINSTENTWSSQDISFNDVTHLAFPNNPPNFEYIVLFSGAKQNPSSGSMSKGDIIHLQNNTIFNVTESFNS